MLLETSRYDEHNHHSYLFLNPIETITAFYLDDIPDQDNPRSWQDQITLIQMEINRQLTENLHRMEHGDIRHLARIEAIDPKVQELYFGKRKRK